MVACGRKASGPLVAPNVCGGIIYIINDNIGGAPRVRLDGRLRPRQQNISRPWAEPYILTGYNTQVGGRAAVPAAAV
jgi:hypothetical protein